MNALDCSSPLVHPTAPRPNNILLPRPPLAAQLLQPRHPEGPNHHTLDGFRRRATILCWCWCCGGLRAAVEGHDQQQEGGDDAAGAVTHASVGDRVRATAASGGGRRRGGVGRVVGCRGDTVAAAYQAAAAARPAIKALLPMYVCAIKASYSSSPSSASWRRLLLCCRAVSPPKTARFEPSLPLRLDWIELNWVLYLIVLGS